MAGSDAVHFGRQFHSAMNQIKSNQIISPNEHEIKSSGEETQQNIEPGGVVGSSKLSKENLHSEESKISTRKADEYRKESGSLPPEPECPQELLVDLKSFAINQPKNAFEEQKSGGRIQLKEELFQMAKQDKTNQKEFWVSSNEKWALWCHNESWKLGHKEDLGTIKCLVFTMNARYWPNKKSMIWKWNGSEAYIADDCIKIQMYLSDPFDLRNLFQIFCPIMEDDDKMKEQKECLREPKNKYNEVGLDKQIPLPTIDEINGSISEKNLEDALESNRYYSIL